jgi:hypothetical protein
MAKYERSPAKQSSRIGQRQWAFSDIQLLHSVAPSRFITSIELDLQYRRQSDAGNDRNCKGASEVGPSCYRIGTESRT